MVKTETFLALEASLSERLSSTYVALLSDLLPGIDEAIKDEDYEKARKMASRIDVTPVFEFNKGYVKYVSNLAMLFGASRVIDDPTMGMVGLGFETPAVDQFVRNFEAIVSGPINDQLQKLALKLISRAENPEPASDNSEYLGTVLKAAKPSAVLPFSSFMKAQGQTTFNVASSLHTSRLSAYGFTAEANALGLTKYAINEQLDGRTCPVCEYMHGQTFDVADARGLLDIAVRTQDAQQLKFLQPWPSQSKAGMEFMQGLNKEQLVQQGWHVPPFHPRCRGLLTRVGRVPTLTAEGPKAPPAYESSQDDFDQLGTKFNQNQVKLWNQLVSLAPSEVLSRLSGQPLDALLSGLVTAQDPKSYAGLEKLKTAKAGVNVVVKNLAFGSKKPVLQDLWFRTDKSLFVGSVEIAAGDEKVFKKLMQAHYGIAKDAGMNMLVANAGSDLGGYALAKYGFTVSPAEWEALQGQIKKTMGSTEVMDMASEAEKKAVDAILASSDPKNVFALADIPHIGKALLSEAIYSGALDFSDAESMARFLTYFG